MPSSSSPHPLNCSRYHLPNVISATSLSSDVQRNALPCRCLSVLKSSDCFLGLADVSLQSLAYEPKEAQTVADLCSRLPPFAEMTVLTQLQLHNNILHQELSSVQCLSLLELSLVRCTPKEMPPSLHTAFPSLQSLHIEEDKFLGYDWENAKGHHLITDWRMLDKCCDILRSLPRLRQLSGNTIVRFLAERNVLRG